MTTTISFATRDCLVMGCDSLATSTKPMIDPYLFINKFIDISADGEISLKKEDNGNEILRKTTDIASLIEDIPYNQQTNVTKIYHLPGTKIGVLFAGIASIGDMSVMNIIDAFVDDANVKKYIQDSTVTVQGITTRLADYIDKIYQPKYKDEDYKPIMEVMVSGYSDKYNKPEILKIIFNNGKKNIDPICKRGESKIAFGGQYNVIERIVLGIDYQTFNRYLTSLVSG